MVYETYTLIRTIKKMYPVIRFLKDRYFPDGRTFYSEKALIETKKKGRMVAPFVVPVVGGIAMESEGYRAYEVDAPYIAPKFSITAKDLERKAFGESPESGRSPEERENELEAECIDDLRNAITRRFEVMCGELLLNGKILMKHYATAADAAEGEKYSLKYLQFYDTEFKNRYRFTKDFAAMTASERIMEFYKMAAVLRKRGVRATDIVMTSDVSMLLMSDIEFLEFYNKARVEMGGISQEELPEGVVCNGSININGIVMTMFTYDEEYEDLDGTIKPVFPKGTIAFLHPGMGETAYAQVTLVEDKRHRSYAERIVARLAADEGNNMVEVQSFSRPVPYPLDWDGWLVSNIYEAPVSQEVSDNSVDTDEAPTANAELKTETEILAMAKKADVIAYAESIGLSGLDADVYKLDELKDAVLNYQEETYGE